MKRITGAVCCAMVVGIAALTAAQSSTADKGSMAKGMKGGPVMMTGCVSEGTGGHYMLTNAMMSGDMKGKMKGDMKPMSYDLMGGDLKAHVGHKVEVSGTMASDTMMKDGKMDKSKMDKSKMDKSTTSTSGEMHGGITVTSVKMIAATCS